MDCFPLKSWLRQVLSKEWGRYIYIWLFFIHWYSGPKVFDLFYVGVCLGKSQLMFAKITPYCRNYCKTNAMNNLHFPQQQAVHMRKIQECSIASSDCWTDTDTVLVCPHTWKVPWTLERGVLIKLTSFSDWNAGNISHIIWQFITIVVCMQWNAYIYIYNHIYR